jgi:DNA-directed RNA polymerase specialized sigma24 family protein
MPEAETRSNAGASLKLLRSKPTQARIPLTLKNSRRALDQLAKVEPKLAELVDMKFFCGFSFAEIAALENLSERTVQRKWEKARIYLHQNIRADLPL